MTDLLNLLEFGEGPGTPLIIAHGLFGSARNWSSIAKALSGNRRVVAVDMRNHGESFRAASQSYEDMADDLARVITHIGAKADVLGHSMGGKAAMVLAHRHPELVDRLIVADIAPVGYGHSQTHLVEAMQRVDLSAISRRADADRQLTRDVPEPAVRLFLLQSLAIENASARWRLNLEVLGREMPGIIGFPDLDSRFEGTTLFLTGGASDYVRPEHRSRIETLFPAARTVEIAGAGHWLHADKPHDFIAAVRDFLG